MTIQNSISANSTTPLSTIQGGTGLTTYSRGDLIYSNAADTLAILPKSTSSTRYLSNRGANNDPKWDRVNLPDGVQGTLLVTNGGTGVATNTAYAVLCGGTTAGSAIQSVASVGTTGQVLTSNGAGALPTFQSLSAGGGLQSFQVFTSGSGTYTLPGGITKILVEIVGGGGGGGGLNSSTANVGGGGGGGSGAYVRSFFSSPSSTYSYAVGAGGAGGNTSGSAGATGGTTTFDSMSAGGGGGGNGDTAIATLHFVKGGGGGIGTGGNIVNAYGNQGGHALVNTASVISGCGGGSYFTSGIDSVYITISGASSNGFPALGNGGGGSGAASFNTNADRTGGDGSGGIVIVWEFA